MEKRNAKTTASFKSHRLERCPSAGHQMPRSRKSFATMERLLAVPGYSHEPRGRPMCCLVQYTMPSNDQVRSDPCPGSTFHSKLLPLPAWWPGTRWVQYCCQWTQKHWCFPLYTIRRLGVRYGCTKWPKCSGQPRPCGEICAGKLCIWSLVAIQHYYSSF